MSKKGDNWFKATVLILVVGIIFMYLKNSQVPSEVFDLEDMNSIVVSDMSGQNFTLDQLLSDGEHYIFMFTLSNCDTCVYDGLSDLQSLQASGKKCVIVVVHDWLEEVKSWAVHAKEVPVFMQTKDEFYTNVSASKLPVLATINEGKVEKFRIFTLN